MQRLLPFAVFLALVGCDSAPVTTPATSPTAEHENSHTTGVGLSIVSFEEIQERIAQNRGKVVVIDAWSTSCAPCLAEFHNLVELHHQYGPEKLACISLSFDYEGLGKPEDQQDRVLKFLRDQGATFENMLSNEESDVLYRKFHLAAIPAVFVYDRAGKLRKRFDNENAKTKEEAFTYAQVKQLVAELINEGPDAEATLGNGSGVERK